MEKYTEWGREVYVIELLNRIVYMSLSQYFAKITVTCRCAALETRIKGPYRVKEFADVVLECTANDVPSPIAFRYVHWQRKVGTESRFTSIYNLGAPMRVLGGKIESLAGSDERTYRIKMVNTSLADEGQYRCRMDTDTTSSEWSATTVNVLGKW